VAFIGDRETIALPPIREHTMAIYKLLQNTVLGPEEIKRLTDAYELTLKAYSLKDRSDPLTQLIAKKIFEIGQTGIEDSAQLSKLAIMQLGIT
jgi:hypothetical protein